MEVAPEVVQEVEPLELEQVELLAVLVQGVELHLEEAWSLR